MSAQTVTNWAEADDVFTEWAGRWTAGVDPDGSHRSLADDLFDSDVEAYAKMFDHWAAVEGVDLTRLSGWRGY